MAEMTVYDELVARGLIAQVTDEELIKNLINNGKATFYIGFDPTADSLHVGHFMALCFMKRLQMAGNKPIALVGGGTGMIGDPSGKTDMRKMLTPEQIEHNCECFKKQMSKFIDFSDDKALFVNNAGRCCAPAHRRCPGPCRFAAGCARPGPDSPAAPWKKGCMVQAAHALCT